MSANKKVKVYKDTAGYWRWTYWRSSDRVAISGEGYQNKSHVLEQVADLYPGVPVEEVKWEATGETP